MSQTEPLSTMQKLVHGDQRNKPADAEPSNEESLPELFKLTIDCFDEIFDYLSLKDLYSFGETCKTMQQVAGEYFKLNYAASMKTCTRNGIYMAFSGEHIVVINQRIEVSDFNRFTSSISVSHNYGSLGPLRYLNAHIDEFESIKHITLKNLRINSNKVEFFEKLLHQIETIEFKNCSMDGNCYDLILKHCKHLKCIHIQYTDCSFNRKHDWIRNDYPQLEHLELSPRDSEVINELSKFFQRNPNVRKFTTNGKFLWDNQNIFVKSNARLDLLEIKGHLFLGYEHKGNEISIWDLLSQLYQKRFYKRLTIHTKYFGQDLSHKLNMFPSLETLSIEQFTKSHSIPNFTNLRELIILEGLNASEAETLAIGLVKLERLFVAETNVDHILPFIRQSAKLNKLELFFKSGRELQRRDSLDDMEDEDFDGSGSEESDEEDEEDAYNFDNEDNFENEIEHEANDVNRRNGLCKWNAFNLNALNKEREKLSGARKVRIFVSNDVFLTTKWNATNGNMNWSQIEVRRSHSYDWNHHCISNS